MRGSAVPDVGEAISRRMSIRGLFRAAVVPLAESLLGLPFLPDLENYE